MANRLRHLGWRSASCCRASAPARFIGGGGGPGAEAPTPHIALRPCAPPRGGRAARCDLGRAVNTLPGRAHGPRGHLGSVRTARAALWRPLPRRGCARTARRVPTPLPAVQFCRRWQPPRVLECPGCYRLSPRGLTHLRPRTVGLGFVLFRVRVQSQPPAQSQFRGQFHLVCNPSLGLTTLAWPGPGSWVQTPAVGDLHSPLAFPIPAQNCLSWTPLQSSCRVFPVHST